MENRTCYPDEQVVCVNVQTSFNQAATTRLSVTPEQGTKSYAHPIHCLSSPTIHLIRRRKCFELFTIHDDKTSRLIGMERAPFPVLPHTISEKSRTVSVILKLDVSDVQNKKLHVINTDDFKYL